MAIDYEELYTRRMEVGGGQSFSIEDIVKAMGRPDIDLDKFRSCGMGAAVARMMENFVLNPDEHSPASVAYWAKRGMVKEFHGEDVPMDWKAYEAKTGFHYEWVPGVLEQNKWKKWTSFVPVSAYRPENKDRKYPLIFVLHGAGNTIYTIDGWGYVNVAAEKEWIVIVPSIEIDDVVLGILEEAKQLWNVDESRVYVSGFSFGSMNTNILAHQHADIFAAAGPCGGFLTDGKRGRMRIDPKKMKPEQNEPFIEFNGAVPKSVELGIKMPIITVSGNRDGYKYPIFESPDGDKMTADLNLWARINDAPEISFDGVKALADKDASPVEKAIGIPLAEDCRHSEVVDGVEYTIGDLRSRDGIARVRVVCEDNVPHWPTPELSRLVLNFFEHFSRDAVTKESIYTK